MTFKTLLIVLTWYTCRPSWCGELVVWQAGEGVSVLVVVGLQPIVVAAGRAVVYDLLPVTRGVCGVPHFGQLVFRRWLRRVDAFVP